MNCCNTPLLNYWFLNFKLFCCSFQSIYKYIVNNMFYVLYNSASVFLCHQKIPLLSPRFGSIYTFSQCYFLRNGIIYPWGSDCKESSMYFQCEVRLTGLQFFDTLLNLFMNIRTFSVHRSFYSCHLRMCGYQKEWLVQYQAKFRSHG